MSQNAAYAVPWSGQPLELVRALPCAGGTEVEEPARLPQRPLALLLRLPPASDPAVDAFDGCETRGFAAVDGCESNGGLEAAEAEAFACQNCSSGDSLNSLTAPRRVRKRVSRSLWSTSLRV